MSFKRGFKRKSYGRRRFTRKRGGMGLVGYAKAGMSAYSMAKSALAAIWRLKGLVNSEMHKLDSNSGNVNAVNTGVIDDMCKVAVGDTYADRTGNSIFVRSLNIKGQVSLGASETLNILRLAVVLDTQQISDTTPVWTDIYDSASVNAHLSAGTVGRFKVLLDRRFYLNSVSSPQIPILLNIPMRHHVRYNGSATTDIQKGSIYVVYIGSYTTNAPVVNYRARLSFHDN